MIISRIPARNQDCALILFYQFQHAISSQHEDDRRPSRKKLRCSRELSWIISKASECGYPSVILKEVDLMRHYTTHLSLKHNVRFIRAFQLAKQSLSIATSPHTSTHHSSMMIASPRLSCQERAALLEAVANVGELEKISREIGILPHGKPSTSSPYTNLRNRLVHHGYMAHKRRLYVESIDEHLESILSDVKWELNLLKLKLENFFDHEVQNDKYNPRVICQVEFKAGRALEHKFLQTCQPLTDEVETESLAFHFKFLMKELEQILNSIIVFQNGTFDQHTSVVNKAAELLYQCKKFSSNSSMNPLAITESTEFLMKRHALQKILIDLVSLSEQSFEYPSKIKVVRNFLVHLSANLDDSDIIQEVLNFLDDLFRNFEFWETVFTIIDTVQAEGSGNIRESLFSSLMNLDSLEDFLSKYPKYSSNSHIKDAWEFLVSNTSPDLQDLLSKGQFNLLSKALECMLHKKFQPNNFSINWLIPQILENKDLRSGDVNRLCQLLVKCLKFPGASLDAKADVQTSTNYAQLKTLPKIFFKTLLKLICKQKIPVSSFQSIISNQLIDINDNFVDGKDKSAHTVLHLAYLAGHDELVDFLIQKGANESALCSDKYCKKKGWQLPFDHRPDKRKLQNKKF